jgi:hypothetical protein
LNHQQFTVGSLALDGHDVPLVYAHVVVVHHSNTADEDWECIAASRATLDLELAPCAVEVTTLDGSALRGDAVVVRSDGHSHVLRGVGALLPV